MANVTIKRTDVKDTDFLGLVKLLDADLAIRDGDEHAFYNQFNALDVLLRAVVAYSEGKPIGCGGIKKYDSNTVEVKRMFTDPNHRGKGVGAQVLEALETLAMDEGYSRSILETGVKQPEAIALHTKMGYHLIPNYDQYKGVVNSRCFQKNLSRT